MVGAGVGALRVLRALVFLAVTIALTTAGHVVGGGRISLPAVAALALVAWPVALLGSRRQRGFRHLYPALAALQLAGHAVLAFLSDAESAVGAACMAHVAHHGHQVLDCGQPVAAAMTGSAHSPAMTLAHLLTAGVLASVLARGEALLWRVVDLVVPVVPHVNAFVTASLRPAFVVVRAARSFMVLVLPGRGPPVAA